MSTPAKPFGAQLRAHVDRLGAVKAASICGVTPRSLYLWMRGPRVPCIAMQAGCLLLLKQAHAPTPNHQTPAQQGTTALRPTHL